MLKTNIYIDGFNLYFGCLRRSPFRWLNVHKLCSLLLTQNNQINRIKYFTAPVSARPEDPQQPMRQQMYFRALKTIPNLEIICGQFKTRKTKMPLVNEGFDGSEKLNNHIMVCRSHNDGTESPDKLKQHLHYSTTDLRYFKMDSVFVPFPKDRTQSAYVRRTDEKGSDVNLATHLLYDAFKNDFAVAVVVSDDSDLQEAIRLTVSLGKKVGVLNPQQRPPSRDLLSVATFSKPIRAGALSASLFPSVMKDSVGEFHKPDGW